MNLGWQFWLAFGLSFIGAGIVGLLLFKPIINFVSDAFLTRLLKDPYPENLGEMYNVFTKVGVQNVLEADLRGNQGEPLERPFGSPIHFSPWEKLLLNPVYLSGQPVAESDKVDVEVVLGPQAARPLHIGLPMMVAGMGYGFGPSYQAKIALAKGADQVNTATNTGVGPFLPEERKSTKRLILQYHRGAWGKDEKALRQADMIEIQLGYGALGSAPVTLGPENISPDFREYMGIGPDQSLHMSAVLPEVRNRSDLAELVEYLRKITGGVPIGVKFGATHYLEEELEIMTGAGIDFLTIDGAEAGISFGPPILADSVGLPTLPALCRTVAFLKKQQLQGKVSLIVSGGFVTPGQVLKALALGADAVYMGTITMIVLAHLQLTKVIPWEPPTELVYERGKQKDRFVIEEGARSIANFLKSCQQEMIMALRSMGKKSLAELSVADLCALSPEVSQMTGVESGLFTPGKGGT
jgi:glutamate synthase domain-containing protein 2